jgi:hypothetical protein
VLAVALRRRAGTCDARARERVSPNARRRSAAANRLTAPTALLQVKGIMRTSSPALAVLASSLALAASLVLATDDAGACGGFFVAPGPDVPSLEVEQTLIIHDPVKQVEHFVREVTFRQASTTFGFVVPTPTRPEVAKVADAPFLRLGKEYPLREVQRSRGLGGIGLGSGGGGGSPSGVEVLSKQKLGSFTVFVLAATDAAGLKRWLDSNHFQTTPQSEAWLKHYVDLRFHFVASRFDPPATAKDAGAPPSAVHAETLRITFPTPVPYYPYLEPEHPTPSSAPPGMQNVDTTPKRPRVLAVWFIAPREATPVAAFTGGGIPVPAPQWKRPWLEGTPTRTPLATVKTAVGKSLEALLPAAVASDAGDDEGSSLSMQVFEDQKTSRKGFGDVVFVPNAPVTLSDAELASRRPFFALLDPRRSAQ